MKLRTMVTIAALVATPKLATAQDFYDGMRGPASQQIDLRIDQKTQTVIPKYFGKSILVAAPIVRQEGVRLAGVNAGYIAEPHERIKGIAALGLFRNGDGKYGVLNPQAYVTATYGPWSADILGQAPTDLYSGKMQPSGALTLGAGTNRWRIGSSVTADEKGFHPQLLSRIDASDHRYWAEVYVNRQGLAGRLVINF